MARKVVELMSSNEIEEEEMNIEQALKEESEAASMKMKNQIKKKNRKKNKEKRQRVFRMIKKEKKWFELYKFQCI